jgi:hypothetical protein
MERSGSGRHYLTFETDNLSADDCAQQTVEKLERRGAACQLLPTPSLSETAFHTPAGSGDHGRLGSKQLYSARFDQLPDRDLLADINQGRYRSDGGPSEIGADLPIHVADYWSPAESMDPIFGTRKAANELMAITAEERKPGTGANVVIVDQGLNQKYVAHLGGDFGGGWHFKNTPRPGGYGLGHGSMLARNVLRAAPDAAIYDLPVIPHEINDRDRFLSTVHVALNQVLESIRHLRATGEEQWLRPWVFVNAWATFNAGHEQPEGDYTKRLDHKFNLLIAEIARDHDVVFAAGNCGQFCPDRRCGTNDVGPGHSIIGANSHPDVLTVGAVRTDGMWLGYSSQGPGALSDGKPDLCAVSQFREDDDAGSLNTGTSAACAVAAGVVASLRTQYQTEVFNPAELKEILIKTATATPVCGHDYQLGHGVLNAAAALKTCQQRDRR